MRLRAEAAQKTAGRTSFDIAERDGRVWPRDPEEARFLGPNGMSMRPKGPMLAVIVASFRGGKPSILEVPAGTAIPPELVLLHEHSDHYSVQPASPMTLAQLNTALTRFLSQPSVVRFGNKAAFYERHPDMHPDAVGFSENA